MKERRTENVTSNDDSDWELHSKKNRSTHCRRETVLNFTLAISNLCCIGVFVIVTGCHTQVTLFLAGREGRMESAREVTLSNDGGDGIGGD